VDNPAAHSANFSGARTGCAGTLTITPIRNRSRTLFFICQDRAKAVPALFLSCTKNTELTRGGFALTFCFALKKKRQNVPAAKAALRTINNNGYKGSSRVSAP
jgi:hypothetical protein